MSLSWLRFSVVVALLMLAAVLLLPAYFALTETVQLATGLLPLAIAAMVAVLAAQPVPPFRARRVGPLLLEAAQQVRMVAAIHVGLLPALFVTSAPHPLILTLRGIADLILALLLGLSVGRLIRSMPLAGLTAPAALATVWIIAATVGRGALTGLCIVSAAVMGVWLWLSPRRALS